MNYREYQKWSLKRDPDALWLGELDVFKVMEPLSATPYKKQVSSINPRII